MWSRIKPKKMYTSLFLYSCIAVSLLTLAFTVYLSRQFAESALEEINKSNQEKMNQVVQTSEFTLQKLRQFALGIYSDENIALWLNMDNDDYSPISLNKAAASVREFMSSEPFIHAIYLLNFNIGKIYTSESSIYTMQDFYDTSILDYIETQTTPYLQYIEHEVKGESYLALVVPAAGRDQNYPGFVAILFSKQMLNKHMLQISEQDQNKIYIEGKNKEFILGNTDSELTAELAEASKPAEESGWQWTSGKEIWSVQTAQLPIEGWKVYHLSPISAWQAKIAHIRADIIGSSIVLVLALLLFLLWQSYRLKPISDLVLQIQSKLGKKHSIAETANPDNEIAWIHSSFDLLSEKLEQLDLSIKSSKALVKEDFLRQWILGSKAPGPIERFIRDETSILRTGSFRMAVIRLESYGRFEACYDFASRKLLRFALGNMMAEVLANHGFAAETVDFGSDHIVGLISSSSDSGKETARVIEAMEDVRAQIRRWLKLELQAAVSSVLDGKGSLQTVYAGIYELTLMSFLSNEDRVFTPEDPERYQLGEAGELDEELLMQVVHAVRLKNEHALEGYLDRLTIHMQALSYEECKLQLTHLIYSVMKSLKNDKTFQGMSSIHTFLEQFSTIGEVKAWLHRELLQIMNRQRPKNASGRKEELAAEMIEYVRNHLHNPMLTVEDVAAHVSVSVNYARQIFKEHAECSLSDYITKQRIKYAIHLLTTTDWTVADITEQSGFQTKSTFFSLFKRATGMTPNQYRSEKTPEKA